MNNFGRPGCDKGYLHHNLSPMKVNAHPLLQWDVCSGLADPGKSGRRLRQFGQKTGRSLTGWSMLVREKMEMLLIFGLMASYKTHRQQEWVVPEPEEFQPFDFRALRNSADNTPSRWSNWREGYVPQNV
jgi:hypothetical protein